MKIDLFLNLLRAKAAVLPYPKNPHILKRNCVLLIVWIFIAAYWPPFAMAAEETKTAIASTGVADSSVYDLSRLVSLAEQNFPLIQEADLQIQIQQAQKLQATWAFVTPIELFAFVGGPTPEAYSAGPYLRTESSLRGNASLGTPGVSTGVSIRGAIPLYTFGKLSALKQMANAGVSLAQAHRYQVKNEIRAQITRAYLGVLFAESFLSLVNDSEKTINQAIKTGEKMLQTGSAQMSEGDLFMLQTLKAHILARAEEARQGYLVALSLIRFLSGLPVSIPLKLAPLSLTPQILEDKHQLYFLETAYQSRPEIHMADENYKIRQGAVRLKKAFFFPDILALGAFTFNYTTNQDYQRHPFLNNASNELSGGVGLGLRYTFDLPAKYGQYQESIAELQKAQTAMNLARQGIALQVQKSFIDLVQLQRIAMQYEKAEQSAQSWVVSAMLNFNSGLSNAQDLFQAIRALTESGGLKRKAYLDWMMAETAMAEALNQDLPMLQQTIQSFAATKSSVRSYDKGHN